MHVTTTPKRKPTKYHNHNKKQLLVSLEQSQTTHSPWPAPTVCRSGPRPPPRGAMHLGATDAKKLPCPSRSQSA